ncbi:hypothetical protein FRC06_000709, partial [Ceratobasidium sp. 370]
MEPDKLKRHQINWFWYAIDYAGGTVEDNEPYQAITWADRLPSDATDPNDYGKNSGRSGIETR